MPKAVTLPSEIRRAGTAAAAGIAHPAQALHQPEPYTKAHKVKNTALSAEENYLYSQHKLEIGRPN